MIKAYHDLIGPGKEEMPQNDVEAQTIIAPPGNVVLAIQLKHIYKHNIHAEPSPEVIDCPRAVLALSCNKTKI